MNKLPDGWVVEETLEDGRRKIANRKINAVIFEYSSGYNWNVLGADWYEGFEKSLKLAIEAAMGMVNTNG